MKNLAMNAASFVSKEFCLKFFLPLLFASTLIGILVYHHHPLNDLIGDQTSDQSYHINALFLLKNGYLWDAYANLSTFRPFGESIVMAFLYYLFGINPYYIVIVHYIFYIYIFFLMHKFFDLYLFRTSYSPITLSWLFVLYFPLYKYVYTLCAEIIHISLVSSAIYLYLKCAKENQKRNFFFSGFLFGLSVIMKVYICYAVFLFPLLMSINYKYFFSSFNSYLKAVLLFVVGASLVLMPMLYRNYTHTGALCLTTYGGCNLHWGNYALSKGDFMDAASSKYYDEMNDVDAEICKGKNELERNNILIKNSINIIKNNFYLFVKKCMVECVKLFSWSGYENIFLKPRYHLLMYMLYVFLAFWGIICFPRDSIYVRNTLLFFMMYCAGFFSIMFSHSRLKDLMSIYILIFSVIGFESFREKIVTLCNGPKKLNN